MATAVRNGVRDIVLLGHRAAGKTSLSDALLYEAHAVDRLGKVDDGTSVADCDADEKSHHFSIDAHVLHAEHGGTTLHLLDTPGTPDFIGATLEGLGAADTALIVVCAVHGVQPHTRRLWAEAGRRNLARAIVVNKLDSPDADFEWLMMSLREEFGPACVPLNVPDAANGGFSRVLNVLDPAPENAAELPVNPAEVRPLLLDAVCEADEALMERYLTDGDVPRDELEAAIPKAVASGALVPVFCVSATKDVGVRELLDGLSRTARAAKEESGDVLAQVFKVVNDRYAGHLSFLKVLRGKLTPNASLCDVSTGQSCRVGQLLSVQGSKHTAISEAQPGDIVAVAKVEGLHVGDTLAAKPDAEPLPGFPFPAPMFGLAVAPKTRGDETKVAAALHKIAEEDPTLRLSHDPQTHEMILSGVSPLHLDVVRERLKHRFDVDLVAKEPKVPYRETITGPGAGDYKHKKQTGGRGQFAEVHLRVYPLPREITTKEQLEAEFANKGRFEKLRGVKYDPALNFAFLDHVVGGTIPNQYLPAVEKGVREVLERGALAGFQMQDVAVEVYFGKDHPVDSSEAAFKAAGRAAFRRAVLAARPQLLEPVVKLEVTVPSRFTGAVLADVAVRRGHVTDQRTLSGDQTQIDATAPLSEVVRYAAALGGLAQGEGSYALEPSHYEAMPPARQAEVVAKLGRAAEEEE